MSFVFSSLMLLHVTVVRLPVTHFGTCNSRSIEDPIGNRPLEIEAQKAHEVAWIRHNQAHQNHMDAFYQYEKHWGETLDKSLQPKLMDASGYHLAMAEHHEEQREHHAEMASQHKLNATSCTGASCTTFTVASTASARKSAKSAEGSSSHTKTEMKFLNLATHYEDQSAANSKHQTKAEKLRKSAVHYNSLWRLMPGKRFTRHKLSKHYTRAGIPLE